MPDDLRRLLDAGLLEEVAPHGEDALLRLDEAERHLASAEQIEAADPNGAFQLAYDAARKAATAHMLARGLRVTNQPGAHATTGRYALVELGEAFVPLDRMRRRRNRSEYGTTFIGQAEVAAAIADARVMVAAVRARL
jgi:uncharacterized protein (UPF0332 family)